MDPGTIVDPLNPMIPTDPTNPFLPAVPSPTPVPEDTTDTFSNNGFHSH